MVSPDDGLSGRWQAEREPRRHMIADLSSEKFSRHLSQCSVFPYGLLCFYSSVEGGVRSEILRNLVGKRPSVREKMAENGRIRSDAETKLLLEIWSQDNIQKQLQGSFSNVNVFSKLVE